MWLTEDELRQMDAATGKRSVRCHIQAMSDVQRSIMLTEVAQLLAAVHRGDEVIGHSPPATGKAKRSFGNTPK